MKFSAPRLELLVPRAFAIRRWWAMNYQRYFNIILADNEGLYYVSALAEAKSAWMAIATHTDFPPPEYNPDRVVHNYLRAFVMGFIANEDKPYWRACLPFNSWKVRTRQNKTMRVHRSHKLIQDYITLEECYDTQNSS